MWFVLWAGCKSDKEQSAATETSAPEKGATAKPEQRCPDGAELAGKKPPDGFEQWCQKQDANGSIVKHGKLQKWNRDGAIDEEITYKDGNPHGPYRSFDGGKLFLEGQLVDGKEDGAWKRYMYRGWKTDSSLPSTDLDRMTVIEFAKPSITHELYKDGMPVGEWVTYDVNGKKAIVTRYEDGSTVSWTCFREDGTACPDGDEACTAEVHERANHEYSAPNDSVACPFVYAASGNAPLQMKGEVLRNINRTWLEAWQDLELSGVTNCAGAIHVRLAEEKRETSYIDSVLLVVGSQSIRPDLCATGDHPACGDDGVFHALAYGEQLDLVFTPPAGKECQSVTLRVDGYYLPAD